MQINFKDKNLKFNIIITLLTFVITCVLIYSGTVLTGEYDYAIGDISSKRFYAKTEAVNEVATEKLRLEAINSVASIYTHSSEIDENILTEIDEFFNNISNISTTDFEVSSSSVPIGITNHIYLTQEQILSFNRYSSVGTSKIKKNITDIVENQLNTGIRNDTLEATLTSIKSAVNELDYDEETTDIIYSIISDVIQPNLIIDTDATEKAQQEKADEVEPKMVLKNQKIIDEGEIITEEIYSILENQGFIKKHSLSGIVPSLIGQFFVIFLLLSILILYLYRFYNKIQRSKRSMLFIFTLYFLCIFISFLIGDLTYFLIPLIVISAIASMIFDAQLAIVINFIFSIICGIIYNCEIQFLIYFIIMGTLSAFSIRYYTDRAKLIYIAGSNSVMAVILNMCLLMAFDIYWKDKLLMQSIYAFLSVSLSYVLLTGSLPIWEGIFGLVTNLRLAELINPNMPLMHRLLLEAPGTYHHCLVVSNLAEAAAYNINANPTLAKVGAYYHDIGKLYAPSYFTENIRGESPHDNLTPQESAKIITAHTSNGAILGKKHKLPPVIIDIIKEHHGTTMAKYFYYADKKNNPDADKAIYTYPGPIPSTKESAIIMMADVCEAAVRSKSDKNLSYDELREFIKELINEKLVNGQFADCDITFKDLELIVEGFMDIFKGMYHQRISYPEKTEE